MQQIDPQLADLKRFIKRELDATQIKKYERYATLFEDTRAFVRMRDMVVYGGVAIDLLLPDDEKIYPVKWLADIDVFSTNSKKDAMACADFLYKRGHRYIEVREGLHKGTYKVYAEFQPVADFTLVTREFAAYLVKETRAQPDIYHRNGLWIAPIPYLMWSFYTELSRPESSFFRWKKVFQRYTSFFKQHSMTYPSDAHEDVLEQFTQNAPQHVLDMVQVLASHVRKNQIPVVGSFAVGLYLGFNQDQPECCRMLYAPYMDLLCYDMESMVGQLRKLFHGDKLQVKYYKRNEQSLDDVMPYRCRISVEVEGHPEPIALCRLYEVSDSCFSIKELHGYVVGSIDTVLQFLYAYHMTNSYYSKGKGFTLRQTQQLIAVLEHQLENNAAQPLSDRFSTQCYGVEDTLSNIKRKLWERSIFVYRPSDHEHKTKKKNLKISGNR
jgi:hypothetical protein